MSRPFVPSDLLRLRIAQSPVLSVDGRVAFVVHESDGERDERLTAVWVADESGVRRFTGGEHDASPRFSPDGRTLAFVRSEGERRRIYLLPTSGGEARPLSPAYDALGALRWSPDGSRIAFTAKAERDAGAEIYLDQRSGARHIRTLLYKSDEEGLGDGRRRHLFVVDAGGGATEQMTRGEFDVAAPSWSPAGDEIAFAAQIDLPETSFRSDIWIVAAANGTLRRLTRSLGWAASPAFSNDGRSIAYIGHEHGDDGVGGSRNMQVFVVPREGGTARCLTERYRYGIGDHVFSDTRGHGSDLIAWSEDDAAIFALATVEGSAQVVRVGVGDGSVAPVVGDTGRSVTGADVGRDCIAFIYTDPLVPAEVAVCALDGGGERRLTELNPWLAEIDLATPERLRPLHADGTRLDLWVMRPPRAGAGDGRLPLVFEIHGGPHGCYGSAFFIEFQMLAGQGLAVAYGNIRGSQSYGEAFARAVMGDWGGIDVADALTLLDAAVTHLPADPARVAVAGGSYGGFMTSLLMGRAAERFACGISMRAVNEMISMIGSSDLGWFLERELEASLLEGEAQRLYAASPLSAAKDYRAPLLILHGERDYRCPLGQAEELFQLLRRLRKPVEMVRFERDSHGLSRDGHPRNRILRLRAIAHWMARWLLPERARSDAAGWLFAPLEGEAGDATSNSEDAVSAILASAASCS
ncbi:MAG: S9 family peptidase [bacterium]|nr:S9 family peptidase [bacterium]